MTDKQYQNFIRQILGSRVVAYYPSLAHVVHGVKGAVMLSQLLYWSNNKSAKERGGWIWKTVEQCTKETGLTKDEQRSARTELVRLGVIEARLKGIPRRWWYKVNLDAIVSLLPDEGENDIE